MLLYLELKRWIVTAGQINMLRQTPNANTISSPLFSDYSCICYRVWLRKPEKGLLLHRCHLCAVAVRVTARTDFEGQRHFGQQQSQACRLLLWQPIIPQRPADLADPQILNATTTVCGTEDTGSLIFLELLCEDLSQVTLSPPKNWIGIFTMKRTVQLWSAQSLLKRHRGPAARSLFTDDNHYRKHKKKGSALLTAAKRSTWAGFAVINVTFTTGFATWKSIICFPGTCAWLSGELEAFTEV